MPQQGQQLVILAKVIVHFRPEAHKTIGKTLTFQQVGLTQEGPFLKIIAGPGSSLEGAQLYHFDIIAGVETHPSKVSVATSMPAEGRINE